MVDVGAVSQGGVGGGGPDIVVGVGLLMMLWRGKGDSLMKSTRVEQSWPPT